MKYTSEYIPNLYIHQHSLLTRRYSFDMIFSTGLLLCINWIIFVFKSSSSSIHIHLQVIWIWIISRSGSSLLDLDHHSIWISRSHHNWIWIIARSQSSLVIIMCVLSRHRNFYRASPFSCWL